MQKIYNNFSLRDDQLEIIYVTKAPMATEVNLSSGR